jgi:hypothetical protein
LNELRHSTSYTQSVHGLLRSIQDPNSAETLYAQAAAYFAHADADKATIVHINGQIVLAKNVLQNTACQHQQKTLTGQISKLNKRLEAERLRQNEQRLIRLDKAISVCLEILSLSEGEDFEETVHQSAKFLGTVLLLSPSQSKTLSELHQRMKPAYKAVLSLRLLDKLMLDELILNPYILEHYDWHKRYDAQNGNVVGFTQSIILPIMMAAIFQDIGLEHPDLQAILEGDNKDAFRLLEPEKRKALLKQSYKQTQDYISNGLGCQKYSGNSLEEGREFEQQEKMRLHFQQSLIKDAIVSKLGVGDIIKIPQVYTSIVLSTKRSYQRQELPKAALLVEKLAQKKIVSPQVAKAFIDIVGYFPQGYGVTYIPIDVRGFEGDGYEYAIVNRLYPKVPKEPICRKVTCQLSYISSGNTEVIKEQFNLRFESSRKKLTKVDKARLIEIMQKLVHQFEPADVANLIPAYWEPHEYFSDKRNQNLWSESS